ncbi:MAG: RDD family protein [Euryarchaeota archaeon]|nr:RDD family protein [Euryarchaeota archaeon]MDE1837004.1 RDD family protein [Euryarchaeota archaeon]MDE1879854.1 RDD family protein [Euryarchaeota archaeon]MDE2045662.1 RDD family protein [Thermoplasmata archaeon]
MVDNLQLAFDTVGGVIGVTLPVLIYVPLFLLGWEKGLEGDRIGFGKRTFLLLLVGGIVGFLANLPLFGWNGSVIMVNVGGALLPVAIAIVLLDRRILPGRTRDTMLFGACFAASIGLTVALLAKFPPIPSHLRLDSLAFLLVFGAGGAAYVLLRPGLLGADAGRSLDPAGAFVLVSMAVWATFLTTAVDPNVGIVSSFPDYLLAPAVVGIAAVLLRWPRRDAPALAFATATLGVLVGADVLHQPELFRTPSFLGSIGGAGPFDLVFLSGPFALGVALGLDLLLRRVSPPATVVEPSAVPFGPLRGTEARFHPGLEAYAAGRHPEVAARVLETLDRDLVQVRAALGLPAEHSRRLLDPVPVHPLLAADLANLRELGARGSQDPEDARRALVVGLLVQRGLLDLLGRRLARVGDRVKAFGVDLMVALLPAVPLFYLVLVYDPLDATGLNFSIPYLAAISALGGWPFLLYAGLEWRWGTTLGKHWMGLIVVGPEGHRPTLLAALARNVPKLLPLAALSLALGLGMGYGYFSTPASVGALIAGLALMGGVFVTALVGLFSVWAIRVSPRRQRLGDVLGGTMVWTRAPPFFPGINATGTPTGEASRPLAPPQAPPPPPPPLPPSPGQPLSGGWSLPPPLPPA